MSQQPATDDLRTYPSPVPVPALDATPPGPYRGVYGMPMFVTVPTADLSGSADFWARGLGFFDLFTIPGQLTHLRRWAFQDVLLASGGRPEEASSVAINVACVPGELDGIRAACEALAPGCTDGPHRMPWNAVELRVVTPENARVTMTAGLPLEPGSAQERYLREIGIDLPA